MINEELRAMAQAIRTVMHPEHIYLFGSFAKGTARPDSDYDLYIVVPDDAGSPLELSKLAYEAVRGLKKRRADITVKHASVFADRCGRNTLERTVLQEGVEL